MLRLGIVSSQLQDRLADLVREAGKKGLKAADIARRSRGGITDSYISKILSGAAGNLSLDKFEALAEGIGLTPKEMCASLFSGEPKLPEGFGTSEFAYIYHLYNNLPERAKKDSKGLIEALRMYLEHKAGLTVPVYGVSDEKKLVRPTKQRA